MLVAPYRPVHRAHLVSYLLRQGVEHELRQRFRAGELDHRLRVDPVEFGYDMCSRGEIDGEPFERCRARVAGDAQHGGRLPVEGPCDAVDRERKVIPSVGPDVSAQGLDGVVESKYS